MSQWQTFHRACPTSWQKSSWHRYGMKKLCHCHRNYATVILCIAGTITTVLRPFVWDYPGEPVPEKALTHPPSWSSSLYQLLPSTTIHSILPVQITCLAIFLHNLSPHPLWSTSWSGLWSHPPHIPYISSPNQCLLIATHARTIATCFAVVSILHHLLCIAGN